MNKTAVTTIIIVCGIISLIFGLYILFFMSATTVEAASKLSGDTFNSSVLWSVFGGVLTGVGVILSIYGMMSVFRDSVKNPSCR
jgi:ABC-type antimicrobial peptide transport system permease subunit